MAYDSELVDRVREFFGERGITFDEQPMFGTLAFLVSRRAVVCVRDSELMVRVDSEAAAAMMARYTFVRPLVMGRREMSGWVVVDPEHLAGKERLSNWIEEGLDHAGVPFGT